MKRMKKRLLLLLATLTLLYAPGCSRSTHGNSSDPALPEAASPIAGEETVRAVIEGEFAARVTACFADIPAYADSDMTGFVLVNEFQGWPFLINTQDPEIASKLETGKVYVFSIEPYDAGLIPASLIGQEAVNLEEWAIKTKITGWRSAEEGEYGVISLAPVYAPYSEN